LLGGYRIAKLKMTVPFFHSDPVRLVYNCNVNYLLQNCKVSVPTKQAKVSKL